MKYLLIQEVTDWDAPNHIYISDETKSKVYGYFPFPSREAERFEKPMQFDTRYRKFKTLAKFEA